MLYNKSKYTYYYWNILSLLDTSYFGLLWTVLFAYDNIIDLFNLRCCLSCMSPAPSGLGLTALALPCFQPGDLQTGSGIKGKQCYVLE